MAIISGSVNVPTGQTYNINVVDYIATKSTTNLIEGTNKYYTDLIFDTRLTTKTTNDLIQGPLINIMLRHYLI